jgi:cellulose synthase/poly-beta-1,6-N-acetylglucosamine synthase-like glycosyltransferase
MLRLLVDGRLVHGRSQIADWAFGLVDAKRQPKPAYRTIHTVYAAPLPPRLEHTPRVSVVVCAYNADRTMDACLESLRTLSYPNYEVVVVNDGSTDRTLAITHEHQRQYAADPHAPQLILADQHNKGLSLVPNVGSDVSTAIIAYRTRLRPRSDCSTSSVHFLRSGFVAVGGPTRRPSRARYRRPSRCRRAD